MQIKKIIAAAAASIIALSSAAFTAFAEEYSTFCFDTEESLSMLQSYGSTTEIGFAASIDEQTVSEGSGSLMLSEKVTESIAPENRAGGLYFEASSLGLDNYAGCTITMKVKFDKEAAKLSEKFSVFTDGVVWMTYDISNEQAGQWVDVALTVPSNANNTRIGFAAPIFEAYDGVIAYVDELTVTKPDGTAVENIGDQKEATQVVVSIGKTSRIILIVVVCIIIVAVIAGIGFIVSKFQSKFTN